MPLTGRLNLALQRLAIVTACLLALLAGRAGAQNPLSGADPEIFVPAIPLEAGELEDRAVITSRESIKTENNVAYAEGRTRVELRGLTIEADRMTIDFVTQELQGEGNVLFSSNLTFIRATAARFNLATGEGVAYGVDGQTQDLFFRSIWDEKEKGPSFRQMSEQESVFRGTRFTTCEFPVPHYYIKASEVILLKDRRVFFRNPVLFVRGVPVFWLPFHTRSLDYGSPWSHVFGYTSTMGAFLRTGYRYIHQVKVPSWDDPTTYEVQSHGQLDAVVDLFSKRGIGYGFTYSYQFDFNRHRGTVQAYGIRDRERDIEEEEDLHDEESRWVYRHKHNSFLADHWIFQLDIDEVSDPDIYYDILDEFVPAKEFERGRLYERRSRAALTYYDEDFIARILYDDMDRLGRDYYTDYSDPFDDDLDFDPEPEFTLVEIVNDDGETVTVAEFDDADEDGIPRNRYGNVRENVYGRFATRLRNIENWPLYYRFEANAFDSLDYGFNVLEDDDDARVRGADFLAELVHRLRIGERTTWVNAVGVGVAYYVRDRDELVGDDDFLLAEPPMDAVAEFLNSRRIDGQRFVDEETIIIGEGERTASAADTDEFYPFVQYRSRLSQRFTQFLTGYVQYRIREGADDSLGEFYERIGRVEAAGDIYDFYTDQHWIEAGLTHVLLYPNIITALIYRQNLQGGSDIYANEKLDEIVGLIAYANPSREFEALVTAGVQTRQIRDRDDPNEFEQASLGGLIDLSYFPRHLRYWASVKVAFSHKLDDDPVNRDAKIRNRFDENETHVTVQPVIGRQFGPKYRVQVGSKWDSRYDEFTEAGITIIRDLHDAELSLFGGVKNNSIESLNDDDDIDSDDDGDIERDTEYEYKFKAGLRFKIAREQPGLEQRTITTLSDLRRDTQYVR